MVRKDFSPLGRGKAISSKENLILYLNWLKISEFYLYLQIKTQLIFHTMKRILFTIVVVVTTLAGLAQATQPCVVKQYIIMVNDSFFTPN